MAKDEEGNESEEKFTHRDYERKFFNDETNIAFCKTFLDHAQKDPISGEIGKSIIFCVSQAHARKITGILNICMMRPIFSPSDFIQIKGRGTRKYTFICEDEKVEKEKFFLFDFFGNYVYFENEFKYDETLKLPSVKTIKSLLNAADGLKAKIDEIDLARADELISKDEKIIGAEGMRIDRELYFQKFEEKVKENKEVQDIYDKEGIDGAAEYVKRHILDKPKEFFTPEKLRRTLLVDRWASFKEMLQKVFGEIDRFKTSEEKVEDEFDKFQDIEKMDAKFVPAARWLFSAYLHDPQIREILDKKEFARLYAMSGIDMESFKSLAVYKRAGEIPYTQYIPMYVRDYVGDLKEFEKV